MTRADAFNALRDVDQELYAARFALARIIRVVEDGQALHPAPEVRLSEFRRCEANLEATYAIRLFAEFERILRDYWMRRRRRATRPIMDTLMNNIAAYLQMSPADLAAAHEVREDRNILVHE